MTSPHRIVSNRARCNGCRQELESMWAGEPVTCECGELTIDGGRSYLQRCVEAGKGNYTELSEHEPVHGEQRDLRRGFLS